MIINIIDRVKHTFSKDRELSSSLQGILGFYPHNLEYYRIAFAHKSQAYRSPKGRSLNNERLEFLGDAILEAVVSDIVYHRFERKREGFLTSTRSKIVQRSSLNRLAAELGIDRLVKTSVQASLHSNNIGGNAFEALIGAIYLDRGYRYCKWFVEKRIMGRMLDIEGVAHQEVNFKSKLLEWTQKNRIDSAYQFDETDNEGTNKPVFHCRIVIEGLLAGIGEGFSKKESQQAAAKDALAKLRKEKAFLDSIFRAKEKRTAMEADEVCAVPVIDEIEEELAHQKENAAVSLRTEARKGGCRHAKRMPDKAVQAETSDAAPEKKEQKAAKKQASAPKTKTDAPKAPQKTPHTASSSDRIDNKQEAVQTANSLPSGAPERKKKPSRSKREGSIVTADVPREEQKDTSSPSSETAVSRTTGEKTTEGEGEPR